MYVDVGEKYVFTYWFHHAVKIDLKGPVQRKYEELRGLYKIDTIFEYYFENIKIMTNARFNIYFA